MAFRHALLLLNRNSRRGRESGAAAIEALRAGGLTLEIPPEIGAPDPVRAIHAHRSRVDLVIVGGGDGSLNRVAEALLETQLPLGILPMGTGNDLARTLGLPVSPDAAAAVILAGHTRRIDLGWVNGKHFFNAATIGLSVAAAQRLTGEVKRRYGPFGYPMTLVDAWKATRPFRAVIRCAGEVVDRRSVQLVIGNGRHHGAGMTVAASAEIDDHSLDLYSLDPQPWWEVLRHLPALRWGADNAPAGIWRRQAATAEIVTDHRMRISTDGEITAHTPATFRVVPGALTVIAPPPEPA